MPLQDQLSGLLDQIRDELGIELNVMGNVTNFHREDVYLVFNNANDLTEQQRQEIRNLLDQHDWHFSRQFKRYIPDHLCESLYFAPKRFEQLAFGYHATRATSLPSIDKHGLLPSNDRRQTTSGRHDCEGNIYVCARLGTPANGDDKGAHWWRATLSIDNRFNDRDWVILKIDFSKAPGIKMYRDIWSRTGVIVDKSIPSVAICSSIQSR